MKRHAVRRADDGFTLIELLIVVVIIGILASIAIPKFANTKEKAYIASMKADLRNLVSAQEGYLADNLTYAGVLTDLDVNESAGITLTITSGTPSWWGATAWHNGTTVTCAIYYGSSATPVAPATQDGVPGCN
ncbi:MAG TPA: prepilin-type N-terminal cleavage/methylation domain-containing protein [Gemmatimonadales bacterium]